jgi:hypothetical protein
MSSQFQTSNFLDVKTFFTEGDVKNIADLISNYVIKDATDNKISLTHNDKDIREYIHNAMWEKLHPNKTFFSN